MSWSFALVEYTRGAAAAAVAAAAAAADGDAAGAGGAVGSSTSTIPCGQPFYLEIEALDACHNRYTPQCTWCGLMPLMVNAQPIDSPMSLNSHPLLHAGVALVTAPSDHGHW